MNWTTERPKKPWYYWARPKIGKDTIIEIWNGDEKERCYVPGDEEPRYLKNFILFSGPIVKPERPVQ